MQILYLIPSPLGRGDPALTLPAAVREALERVERLIVEDERAALRLIGLLRLTRPDGGPDLRLLTKETSAAVAASYLDGVSPDGWIGLMSEAGCPVIADPGAEVVRSAHQRGFRVAPLVGPSAVLLALMASGFSGQRFAFSGYLPDRREERVKAIRRLEETAIRKGETQIFIEAPHRNAHLLEDLLACCASDTWLCVAADLTLPTEQIRSEPVGRWRASPGVIGKRPAIFLLAR